MNDSTRWWVIGSGVVMAIGSFLPWARAGIFSVSGTDGDGVITLALGVVVAIVGIANRPTTVSGVAVLLSGLLGLWIAGNVFGNLMDSTDVGDLTGSIGGGLLLTLIGAFFVAVSGLQAIRDSLKATKEQAAPEASE